MPSLPRRARFQIHLSTAIVMMFVAGGLMWANSGVPGMRIAKTGIVVGYCYGWPNVAIVKHTNSFVAANPGLPYFFRVSISSVFVDLFVAFAILFAVWYACEWMIRRRVARRNKP